MHLFHWRPDDDLADQIERIWAWESEPGEKPLLPPLLPGTGAELVYHFHTPYRFGIDGMWFDAPRFHLVCGRLKTIRLDAPGRLGFVAVRLRAGALALMTQIPAHDLADQLVPTAPVLGHEGQNLQKQLAGCTTLADRAGCLAEGVRRIILTGAGDEAAARAIALAYRDCETATIPQIAQEVGLKQRALERRVRRITGQTLAGIRTASRVQKTMRNLVSDPTARIAESALANGFNDQAHFTNAMRTLGLPSPARFLRQARAMTNFYNPTIATPVRMLKDSASSEKVDPVFR